MENTQRYTGRKLKPILTAQGRKARWLSAQVGISEASLSRIMSGRQSASRDVAEKIVAILGVPLFLAFDVLSGTEGGHEGKEAA